MNRVLSLTKFYTARFAVKVFFAVLLFSAVNAVSDEAGLGQKQFADEISNYQKQRAQNLAQKEVQQNKNIVIAQSQQVAQAKTESERIDELERKLQSVTEELKGLKSGSIPDDKLQSIEDKLSILAEEIDNMKSASVVADPTYEQVYGAGPAASKVYLKDKGLSIGGYGELLVGQIKDGEDNIVDTQRVVLYFGYKFTDRIIFNSEIEFEHATTGSNKEGSSGSASVEFALLDFLLRPEVNLRAGLLLAPFGIVNELHEPTTFFGVFRPSVERVIIPTTWRENGLGLFGDIDLRSAGTFSYRAYLMNSFDARGFKASNNRGLRIKGNRTLFNDVAFVTRLEYQPIPFVTLGGSMYLGNTGQNQSVDDPDSPFNGDKVKGFFQMYEGDIQAQYRGFEGRALVVYTTLDDGAEINALNGLTGDDSVGDEQWGYYLVGGYNLLSLADSKSQYLQYLAPFVRWEQYDSQSKVPAGFTRNPANNRSDLTIGLNYKPIPNVVVKAEYQWLNDDANESNNQINFGLGYIF